MKDRSPRDLTRIACLADTHSGDWLYATLSVKMGLWLTSVDFIRALRLRLGLPVAEESVCAKCGRESDAYGDHTISCVRRGYVRRICVWGSAPPESCR